MGIVPDIRYPGKLFAGYPANSVSGATLQTIDWTFNSVVYLSFFRICANPTFKRNPIFSTYSKVIESNCIFLVYYFIIICAKFFKIMYNSILLGLKDHIR